MIGTPSILSLQPRDLYPRSRFREGVNDGLFDVLESNRNLWLFGEPGVGKTHLVHILVSEVEQSIIVVDPSYELSGLAQFNLVIIDDIESWLGDLQQERSIFGLFEELRLAENRLVVTAKQSVEHTDFALPDLKSRMCALYRYRVLPVPDDQKIVFLQELVEHRGFSLTTEVSNFLVRHVPRTQTELIRIVDKLDQASLIREKKEITIPFVKKIFNI